MSSMETEANRNDSLAKFQSSVSQRPRERQMQQGISSSSIAPSSSFTATGPPSQSRDATSQSRYFTPQRSNPTILVPSSSPLAQQPQYQPYQPFQNAQGPISMPGYNVFQNGIRYGGLRSDPLSEPTNYIGSSNATNASVSRPDSSQLRRSQDSVGLRDEGRPAKRANYGRVAGMESRNVDGPGSPPSPEVVRPGMRRKRPLNDSTVGPPSPTSSDDFPSDVRSVMSGPPKPRIVRGGRPNSVPDVDAGLKKFVMVYPGDEARATAAFHKCNGDTAAAVKLLASSSFTLSPPRVPSATPNTPKITGKVQEYVDTREAERAAMRERGAKSAIYRQRRNLEESEQTPATPSVSPSQVIDIPDSPLAPIRTARTKVRKVVVDSDPESDIEVLEMKTESKTNGTRIAEGSYFERKALESLNTFSIDALRELTGCTEEQAQKIMSLRPFSSEDDLNQRLSIGKKKAGISGISPRMFQDCASIYEGYGTVDEILLECEEIGNELKSAIAAWSGTTKGKEREGTTSLESLFDDESDGAFNLMSLPLDSQSSESSMISPPSLLSKGVQLKDYQIIGINWLSLLHTKRLSCILADEMGLGKTVQVISFLAHLKETGTRGPHLIVVPSSTLENWVREFERFAPSIAVQTYYGGKEERPQLREYLLSNRVGKSRNPWEVLITTYTLAVGDERDRKFFRKVEWNTCVFDEGHVLKNFQSQRYTALTRLGADWKLLLTGTPLQNNLQELVSLMNFILPEQFAEHMESLRAIFKVKGDSKVSLLAEHRVSRAKRMMTPFVLRRRKDQVLKDLPRKTERIEWCEMTPSQKTIYREVKQRSRKTVMETAEVGSATVGEKNATSAGKAPKKGRSNPRAKEKVYLENSANVLMDLRKAALHPMLFRTRFTDTSLTAITRLLLKEPDFKKRGAVFQYVKEDMEVMTDAELQNFCKMYKSLQKYVLDDNSFLEAGKVKMMLQLLEQYQSEGRRCLIFSQFTQILDILQVILKARSIKFLVLTGSTAVDVRQGLVDEFTEDVTIPVFLLSTKAGGMGINLTAASVVILFDQDFNPHNDRQAADRAYRIGQKRDVDIVKLITKGTIEEDMLRLGETKLALDEAVAGDTEEGDSKGESAPEKIMKSSLMETLRKQFEEDEEKESDASELEPQPQPPSPTPLSSTNTPPGDSKPQATLTEGSNMAVDVDSDSELTDIDA